MNFKFLFSQDFDNHKQNTFLYNLKNNTFSEENYSCNITFNVVRNINEIKETSRFEDYVFCGIVFDTLTKYSIYMHNIPFFISEIYSSYYSSPIQTNSEILNQFYQIQALIDDAIYKTLTNSTNSKNIQIYTKLMDAEKTIEKESQLSSYNEIIVLMIFLFTPCSLALLNHLVIEKESRIKESLLIIGLKNSSFWLSWAIIYGLIILINSIIVTIILYHFEVMSFIHWSVILVIMVIYGLSCCCLSFIISVFLKKSKIAMIINAIIIFTFYIVSDIILVIYDKFRVTISSIIIINFFFSPSAFALLLKKIFEFRNTNQMITLLSIFKIKNLFNSFMCLIFTFILYFLIAIYLDNILPQGNNIHRKWHFFITDIFKNKNKNFKNLEKTISNSNLNNPFIQSDPKNQKLAAVQVKHINKKFKVKDETINALNDINFIIISIEINII